MMSEIDGYIVEVLDANGAIKVFWRDMSSSEMFVLNAKLDEPPIPKHIRVANMFGGHTIYRYKSKREINPKWINIVILPKDYLYITYSSKLPLPKPKWNSFKVKFPIHIGTNFFIEKKENRLTLYYLNPNQNIIYHIGNQMDIVPLKHPQLEPDAVNRYFSFLRKNQRLDEKNLIDQIIEQSHNDIKDDNITKREDDVETLDKLNLCLFITNTRTLINALKRIHGIEIVAGGKHPYKARNLNNNLSAPIPQHSRGLSPFFAKKIAKELGIKYETLIEVIK